MINSLTGNFLGLGKEMERVRVRVRGHGRVVG